MHLSLFVDTVVEILPEYRSISRKFFAGSGGTIRIQLLQMFEALLYCTFIELLQEYQSISRKLPAFSGGTIFLAALASVFSTAVLMTSLT